MHITQAANFSFPYRHRSSQRSLKTTMQFRSMISLFIVSCLIVVAFFGSSAASEKVVNSTSRTAVATASSSNVVPQRLRRKTQRDNLRHKRQYGDLADTTNDDSGSDNQGSFGPSGPLWWEKARKRNGREIGNAFGRRPINMEQDFDV